MSRRIANEELLLVVLRLLERRPGFPSRRAPSPELEQVAILFTDVVRSTELVLKGLSEPVTPIVLRARELAPAG